MSINNNELGGLTPSPGEPEMTVVVQNARTFRIETRHKRRTRRPANRILAIGFVETHAARGKRITDGAFAPAMTTGDNPIAKLLNILILLFTKTHPTSGTKGLRQQNRSAFSSNYAEAVFSRIMGLNRQKLEVFDENAHLTFRKMRAFFDKVQVIVIPRLFRLILRLQG